MFSASRRSVHLLEFGCPDDDRAVEHDQLVVCDPGVGLAQDADGPERAHAFAVVPAGCSRPDHAHIGPRALALTRASRITEAVTF